MEIKLQKLNTTETLRYLGHTGSPLDELVSAQLATAEELVLRLAKPRAIYRLFDLNRQANTLHLQNTTLTLLGSDIRTHLSDADQCILMAATLGSALDQEIHRTQVTDMALATVLDATATTAIEQLCDSVQQELTTLAASMDRFLTTRFSPGYGDMPLAQQQALAALLDTRKIGIEVTDHFLLTPRKSVTAILGLSQNPPANSLTACTICNIADSCTHRKAGTPCGKPLPH